MPTRTIDRTVYGQFKWTRLYTTYSNGQTTVSQIGPIVPGVPDCFKRDFNYRSWNNTVGWKAFRAANGYLPTQAFLHQQSQWVQPWPTVTFTQRTVTYQDRRVLEGCPINTLPLDSSTGFDNNQLKLQYANDAIQKCLAKVRDMKVNVSVALAEGRKTVGMIKETAETLGKAYRNFRRGRFKQAADALGIRKPTGSAANHWLAYNYGWMPLVSDLKGLAELAAQQLELGGRPPRLSVKASSSKYSVSWKYVAVGIGPPCLDDGDTTHLCQFTLQSTAGLLVQLKYESAALAAQTGFGLTDPALTAWELIPFSFVFDWFVDVGGWLENMSALQGWDVLTGFYSTTEKFAGSAYYSRLWSGWTQEGVIPPISYTHRKYIRNPWNGSIPSMRMPLFDGLNARRITTSAALWRQRTRGDRVPGKYRP